ncbi:protein phosphatase CheZ [uncultured Dechloromonas sp.]|uniref:protein phosphatase CheZ n=1 Tax=uncultured Dechloromonas sp. TaxID=171719 RepID=UPI0025EE9AC1|nr:protein phosphatase CheZ [uncultured Dechloromonas sp.]
MAANNDSADLEALFDSIAADFPPPAAAAPAPVAAAPKASADGDSDDLQALFDSVSAETRSTAAVPEAAATPPASGIAPEDWPQQEAVFNRLGHMARSLHDTLRELGYDKLLEQTVTALPDAKDRLAYVANLTEQAACRVLNATDIAGPLVDEIENGATELGARWDKAFANQLGVAEFKQLAEETRAYLKDQLPAKTRGTHAQLTEIMMAQDFQDLTGQVIKKVVVLAQELEAGLMGALIDVLPATRRTEEVASLMNGPVVNAEGRSDVVVNQEQVDDLLDSLGF